MVLHNKLFHLVFNLYQNYAVKLLVLPSWFQQRFHVLFLLFLFFNPRKLRIKSVLTKFMLQMYTRGVRKHLNKVLKVIVIHPCCSHAKSYILVLFSKYVVY